MTTASLKRRLERLESQSESRPQFVWVGDWSNPPPAPEGVRAIFIGWKRSNEQSA